MPRRRKALLPRAKPPESGWAFRFLARLAALGWEDALVAGRAVALSNAVTSLEIGRAGARADIKTADGHLEETSLSLLPLGTVAKRRVLKAMAARARFAAHLLAGRLPEDVEGAFQGTGRTLLPVDAGEVVFRCSCAEVPGPCAHAGALAVLLGDRLQDDPFLVFLLRGVSKEELLDGLQRARTQPERKLASDAADPATRNAADPPEPLPRHVLERPELFYRPGEPVTALRASYAPPDHPEAVLTRLGPPPFKDPEATRLLVELHRAIGLGARERLAEWEWRKAGVRG
ncbi:MAG: hypothetical protein PT977_07705 [Acidobacteriota bacterium]|nr:hypothetical protein [Acidobacteriota bacterium]